MADRYVRSTDGNSADSGATWALAKAKLSEAAAIDTAGDRIFVSHLHDEATAASFTLSWAGTVANPVSIICANDSAEPPAALATTAVVSTTGTGSNPIINGHIYVYGITFQIGDGTDNTSILMATGANDVQMYEQCTFYLRGSGPGRINVTGSANNFPKVYWKNCNVKFNGSSQMLSMTHVNFIWEGGSFLVGAAQPSIAFRSSSATRGAVALISGVDLSALDSGVNLFGDSGYNAIIRNCKLPPSWSGSLYSGVMTAGGRVEMHNCDSGDTNYRIWVKEYTGELVQETTIVRTGGASDGTTPLSWKIITTANCNFLSGRFASPEIFAWNDTVGSSVTATIEIVHDNLTALKDDEIWLEVQYLGTSGYPLGAFISDSKADVLASADPQTSSSETWTTTGLTNPNKQKLSVTFIPREKSYVIAKVYLGKSGYTVYVDPKLTIA